jgi:protein disulfide-isomerase
MKKSIALLPLLAVTALADDVAPPGKATWLSDFDKAVLVAKEQKKDLLVDFTGSDWCGWCIRLDKEVFATPEFEAEAPKSYVLVSLDFPRGAEAKAKVPRPERNQELQEQYGVQGFPTVLVLTADGEVLARSGYEEGGPKAWLAGVSSSASAGRATIEAAETLEREFGEAKDDATRAFVVDQAVARVGGAARDGHPTKKLAALSRRGLELDPENKKGLAGRTLKALYAADAATDADAALAKKLDPKNEAGLLEASLAGRVKPLIAHLHSVGWRGDTVVDDAQVRDFVASARELVATDRVVDPAVAAQGLANAAGFAKRALGDAAAAREIAKYLKANAPDDERLARFLDQFLDGDAGK